MRMKNNNNNIKMKNTKTNPKTTQNNKTQRRPDHTFHGVRDAVLADVLANPQANMDMTLDASGNLNRNFVIAPFGVKTPRLTVTGGNLVGTPQMYYSPSLAWLYSTAINFEQYRITNARAVFVGNTTVDTHGFITIASSPDHGDFKSQGINRANGAGAKTFALSSSANKELSVQLNIDPSWKKITALTVALSGTINVDLLPLNTVNDLIASSVSISVNGGPSDAYIGMMVVVYDVEFRHPISYIMNR